jgi:hypothetical protein
MSSTDFFYNLDDMFQSMFLFFDWVGNKLNYTFLALGFVGFFMWMNFQRKFNEKAKNDPNQLK